MAEQVDYTETDREETDHAQPRGYRSERGPFQIFENPPMSPSPTADEIDPEQVADSFEYGELAAKYGEAPVREKIGEMIKSFAGGTSVTPLIWQDAPNGMSLVHAWFGPNFPLFRHSHPAYGDCLYYVVAGEVILGRRRLGAGSGFFIPNGMPYKYTAGPAGVEVLEFRAGGGEPGAPGMQLHEHSLEAIERIIAAADANRPQWRAPERIGDTALRQAELEEREAICD